MCKVNSPWAFKNSFQGGDDQELRAGSGHGHEAHHKALFDEARQEAEGGVLDARRHGAEGQPRHIAHQHGVRDAARLGRHEECDAQCNRLPVVPPQQLCPTKKPVMSRALMSRTVISGPGQSKDMTGQPKTWIPMDPRWFGQYAACMHIVQLKAVTRSVTSCGHHSSTQDPL